MRYAIRTHKSYAAGTEEGSNLGAKSEKTNKNLMTSAVIVSGVGAVFWMVPNFVFGWNYGTSFPEYGTGGYGSYLTLFGTYNPHWYLIPAMVAVGSATAFLGVYLVLRMRWSGFPRRLAVQNFRPVMITTWTLWVLNVFIGFIVYYFFAYTGTG
ncbi:MAG: hypothetical protein HY297_00900 [Thaumarchaeota archaeon]|nr:hypothetical protein [Nitrososphaerota archaeon]